ncbi:hypothetical protein DRQ36_07905 [bacterium]|nr:MAG: hypothetical protein DRQ36_07905 [bacterium]
MKYAILTTLILTTIVTGYTYHGAYLLEGPCAPPSASAAGMGNLSVLPPKNAGNIVWAPALIQDEGIHISLYAGLTHIDENRAMPLYDTFDDRVGWTPYVSTAETYTDFAVFASCGFDKQWFPSIGLGYAPVFDARYIYREEVREQEGPAEDKLLGVWSIDSEGALAGPVFGISENVLEYGSVGLSVAILSGTIEIHRSPEAGDSAIHNAEPWEAAFDGDTVYTAELSGAMISVQAVISPTDRWEIGLRYVPKTDLGESIYPDFLPSRLGIGVGYRPPGYVVSRVVVEAELVGYSQLADEDTAFAVLEDCWEFRLGLEHKLSNGTPLRIGAHYRTVPLIEPVARTGFTIGSGVRFGKAAFDIAGGYEMSRYYHHDQFPETWLPGSPDDREDNDRIEEGILTGAMSVEIEF